MQEKSRRVKMVEENLESNEVYMSYVKEKGKEILSFLSIMFLL